MAPFYATRSAISDHLREEDQAAAHNRLGPFATRTEAQRALLDHLVEGVKKRQPGISDIVAESFVPQYTDLLIELARDPFAHEWIWYNDRGQPTVRWAIEGMG